MSFGFKKIFYFGILIFIVFLLGLNLKIVLASTSTNSTRTNNDSTVFKLEYPEFLDYEKTKSPSDFINKFYLYALGISSSLAIIMIVYGGVKYAVNPGNVANQSDALDIIRNAVFGIVLLAGAYLILKTINPSLVSLTDPRLASIEELEKKGMKKKELELPPSKRSPHFSSLDSSKDAIKVFQMMGVGVSSSGNCYDYKPNCTSFYQFPKGAACKLIEMKYNGASDIVVTAGTEPGHKTHGPGKPVVDLRTNIRDANSIPSLTDKYILSKIRLTKEQLWQKIEEEKSKTKTKEGKGIIYIGFSGSDSNFYYYEANVDNNGNLSNFHWHVRLQIKNEAQGKNVVNFPASPEEEKGIPLEWLDWSYCKFK